MWNLTRLDSGLTALQSHAARPRLGVIGAGYWACLHHLPYLAASGNVAIEGVVGADHEALRAIAAEYNVPLATDSVEELLALELDGVIVSSPNDLHAQHAIAALRAGCHVLVEKPMAITRREAQAMVSAADESGRSLHVAHGWNYCRAAVWAAETAARAIGEIRHVTGHMASPLARLLSGDDSYGAVTLGASTIEAAASTWADPRLGGGYTYGQLSHLLGLALGLHTAVPSVVSGSFEFLENGVDASAAIAVEFADGSVGSFSGTARQPEAARQEFSLRLHGTEGLVTLDMARGNAELVRGRGDRVTRFPVRPHERLYNCDGPTEALIAQAGGGSPVIRATAAAGERVIGVIEAALDSGRTGRAVRLRGPIDSRRQPQLRRQETHK